MRRIFLTILPSFFAFFLSVAQPVVNTSIDKETILIGQQFNLKVQASFSGDDFFIKWIKLPDSLDHFELIQKSKIDSVFTHQKLTSLSQTFTFTSFDSGKWKLPSFDIVFNPLKGDSNKTIFTDSLPVTVAFSLTDTTQTLKDIKTIRMVKLVNPIWYWVAGLLLTLVLVKLGIWLYRKNKSNKKVELLPSNVSAYNEAVKALEKLSAFNLSVPKEVQQYHTQLIDIFRRYLSRKENINYLNKTTGDILIIINDKYRNKDLLEMAGAALRFSDAVKFAKYIPIAAGSSANKLTIKMAIDLVESTEKHIKL